MNIKKVLTKLNFNETAQDIWHTPNLSHEILVVDDRVSIVQLTSDRSLEKILYKGEFNNKVENILNGIQ